MIGFEPEQPTSQVKTPTLEQCGDWLAFGEEIERTPQSTGCFEVFNPHGMIDGFDDIGWRDRSVGGEYALVSALVALRYVVHATPKGFQSRAE